MRILIKRNCKPKKETQEYVRKCWYCKSVYAYTQKDIECDGYNYDIYVKCPVCHCFSNIWFNKKLPKRYKTVGEENE